MFKAQYKCQVIIIIIIININHEGNQYKHGKKSQSINLHFVFRASMSGKQDAGMDASMNITPLF